MNTKLKTLAESIAALSADDQAELSQLLTTEPETKTPKRIVVAPLTKAPEYRTVYFTVTTSGTVRYLWTDASGDRQRLNLGKCYATEQIAKLAAKRQQLEQQMRVAAEQAWEDAGEKLDLTNPEQAKDLLAWDFLENRYFISAASDTCYSQLPPFPRNGSGNTFAETLTKAEQRLLLTGVREDD